MNDGASLGAGAYLGYATGIVELKLHHHPVAAEGVELLGFHVRVWDRVAVAGVAVVVDYQVAVQAVERDIGDLRHIEPNKRRD
jgi:hypothetical protein